MTMILQMLEDAKQERKNAGKCHSSFEFDHSKIDDQMKIMEEQSGRIDAD